MYNPVVDAFLQKYATAVAFAVGNFIVLPLVIEGFGVVVLSAALGAAIGYVLDLRRLRRV